MELSNLHRQILYSDKDLGRPKVEAAAEYLKSHYPKTKSILIPKALDAENAEMVLREYDLVIDGLDRLEKKFFLNDWCVKLKKPFVHAGVVKFEGQVLPVLPWAKRPAFDALIPKNPPAFRNAHLPGGGRAGFLLPGHRLLAGPRSPSRHCAPAPRRRAPSAFGKWTRKKGNAFHRYPRRNPDCEVCGLGLVAKDAPSASCSA